MLRDLGQGLEGLHDPRLVVGWGDRDQRSGRETDERLARLTEQERKILDLVAEGLTNRQIAERIFLAEKTVKNYVSAMLHKLGMQRRSQAAVYGAEVRWETKSE